MFTGKKGKTVTPLKFKVDRLQIILVVKKYISTCRRRCSSVGCLKCVQLPKCVQKEVTSSGETSTLQTGKYTNIQYSINPNRNPKTAFFKKKGRPQPRPHV